MMLPALAPASSFGLFFTCVGLNSFMERRWAMRALAGKSEVKNRLMAETMRNVLMADMPCALVRCLPTLAATDPPARTGKTK